MDIPLSELGVVCGVMLITDLLVAAMEQLHVLVVHVGRSDVSAASVPPLWRNTFPFCCLEVPAARFNAHATAFCDVALLQPQCYIDIVLFDTRKQTKEIM